VSPGSLLNNGGSMTAGRRAPRPLWISLPTRFPGRQMVTVKPEDTKELDGLLWAESRRSELQFDPIHWPKGLKYAFVTVNQTCVDEPCIVAL